MSAFRVIPGPRVRAILSSARPEIFETVRCAYLLHHQGGTVNPLSQFLRFPDDPTARIIALPAHLGGDHPVAGVKWIASFPGNVAHDLPRASAVLLLNDDRTGYPFACLEASQISAARTAASAVLGAEQLACGRGLAHVAVIGCGIIARTIVEYLVARRWPIDRLSLFDADRRYAESFAAFAEHDLGLPVRVRSELPDTIAGADVVVLATTATTPYLNRRGTFAPGQVVLNISLRDIDPILIADAHNIVDDVDHCLRADTSVHLAQQALGHHDFIDGTLAEVMLDLVQLTDERPRIFSPFGLGMLDLAVGSFVYHAALASDDVVQIPDFFAETSRWT